MNREGRKCAYMFIQPSYLLSFNYARKKEIRSLSLFNIPNSLLDGDTESKLCKLFYAHFLSAIKINNQQGSPFSTEATVAATHC